MPRSLPLPLPIVQFNVFPGLLQYSHKNGMRNAGKRGFYFTVKIFKTHKQLNDYLSGSGAAFGGKRSKSSAACVGIQKLVCRKGRKPYYTAQLGEICFHEGSVCMEVIAHECTHAAMRWLFASRKMRGLKNLLEGYVDLTYKGVGVGEDEETLCYSIGTMTWQIQEGAAKKGLKLYA